jgi:glycosyltransferase involved in cell wall biosynthesis
MIKGSRVFSRVLFYDAVGSTYNAPQGPIGTEQNVVLLAEALTRHGVSVQAVTMAGLLVRNSVVSPDERWSEVDTLVLLRYGQPPPLSYVRFSRRVLFSTDSLDITIGGYDHYDAAFRQETDLVVVAAWQLELFRQRGLTGWRSKHVIPGILPESILAKRTLAAPKFPRRFVYASAARKGLEATLKLWASLSPPDAELVVTNPGYDEEEARRILGGTIRGTSKVHVVGVLPNMDAVADLISESAGLFYVNTYPECTSITLAMCEALGRRVHMLCKNGLGGVRETIRSPLVTENADEFARDFFGALRRPSDFRLGVPYNFSAARAAEEWLPLVERQRGGASVARTVTIDDNAPDYSSFVKQAVAAITACPLVDYPLSHVLERPDLSRSGLWLEFGVFQGKSLRQLVAACGDAKVYGFDSFKGLPEDWKPNVRKGSFAVNAPPIVEGAELVVGMFADTLPGFVFSDPVTLVHIDCDIGSAASTALRAVVPHLADGAFIVFDELWNYEGFERHEMRALYDQLILTGHWVQFLYRSPLEPVACRVTRDRPPAVEGTIAVVIPCYQQAKFLPECLASVFAQTRLPDEVIVVVGDTESERVAMAQSYPRPVTVCRDPGWGLAHARNVGIARSRASLIFPLDADDLIEPTCLEEMAQEAKGLDRVIVASWMQEFGDSHGHLAVSDGMLAQGFTSPMCLFSRQLWELVGGYDVASPVEDYAFWLDCHGHVPHLRCIRKDLVRRRMHAAQATKKDPYVLFMSATRFLRPERFQKTEEDSRNVQSREIQEWVVKRLEHFSNNKKLLELLAATSETVGTATSAGTLGLCMIVKNEAKVIERCLASVRPLISHWTIVDTGSTDGTQALVKKALEGIPGELFERPWVDFATNRNEALDFARGHTSHVLVIDADDVLETTGENFSLPALDKEGYRLTVIHGGVTHARPHIFRPDRFRYRGVIHEYLEPGTPVEQRIEGLVYRVMGGETGRNRSKNKFVKDARVLEGALAKEPSSARYRFYLAQSWRDAYRASGNVGYLLRAFQEYRRRASIDEDPEERYQALFEIARCREALGHDRARVEQAYRDAFGYRSFRAEPLFYLARWLRMRFQDHTQAVVFARHAAALAKPEGEHLPVEHAVYDWWALDEFAICASWLPHLRAEALRACPGLLERAPEAEHERIRGILHLCGG